MPRPTPEKDPEAVDELIRRAREARARLPQLVRQIVDLVQQVDPIELLSQLTLLHQTHNVAEQPDRDTAARWQIRIEWLSWLVFSQKLAAPTRPALIDARVLAPLEQLLSEYVDAVSATLPEPMEALSDEQNEVRILIQLDAIHVRGEAYQHEFERLARELYEPHDDWCLTHLGCTVLHAFSVANAILRRFEDALHALRQELRQVADRIKEDPTLALALELPERLREALPNNPPASDPGALADSIAGAWFFARSPEVTGFGTGDLQRWLAPEVSPSVVEAVLRLITANAEDIAGDPSLLSLPPVAVTPLVRQGERTYLFVPSLLHPALLYVIHGRLFADEVYRPRYDQTRAAWLEQSAVAAFKSMLPGATGGWGLEYGPKATRLELDGILQYDNKVVLIECKWKSPTLLARGGDVVAALGDVDKAILQPLAQAKRAREYILGRDQTIFIEKGTGRRIVIRRAEVAEVFLVTMVGSGAWALIAANLVRLSPLGLFADGEYPWAVCINDLRVVAECISLPSELFDYLRRRFAAQREPRFRFHDEWDLLGAYLAGALDVDDPRFADADLIALDQFDRSLQDYHHSRSDPRVQAKKPFRQLPGNIKELLSTVEQGQQQTRQIHTTDAVCAVLAWPNEGLDALSKALEKARRRTVWDHRAHAVALAHPWRPLGVAFACGRGNKRAIADTLAQACESQRAKTNAREWVGFGIDLLAPFEPLVLYYSAALDTRRRKE